MLSASSKEYIMKRADYDRVYALYKEKNPDCHHETIVRELADIGIVPETPGMSNTYTEVCDIYGAIQDIRPHEDICRDYGWSDPAGIEHVALAATQRRKFVVVQTEEDGQSQVQVYVYVEDRSTRPFGWTIDPPVVNAEL